MVEAGDVKVVFTGHDHVNDFCGELTGIYLCYAGGFGDHAYGKAGWARRARVVVASLEKTYNRGWGPVKSIKTCKRLDDEQLTAIDDQVLWSRSFSGQNSHNTSSFLGCNIRQQLYMYFHQHGASKYIIMALPFGLEKVNMKSKGGRAKVLGTLVAFGVAMILTLYEGIPLTKSPAARAMIQKRYHRDGPLVQLF
ncbi:uncharacterized protein LOC130753138 [Actinidia eriantha]|uniref:uncharacterized protein LOC130753138 n=1 Tax=Actinidia eriantha TaxID=165200 RepID=UPI0025855456|nr:uncharacterized protein LOC130753138 [Actinidia eriantha]XP_057463086.1 uncharacterized protein LOC130753138 [Actinidia eriantha]XP_057463087.1 uncharacterized protein LOC130753138 [Actinidia eriantha]